MTEPEKSWNIRKGTLCKPGGFREKTEGLIMSAEPDMNASFHPSFMDSSNYHMSTLLFPNLPTSLESWSEWKCERLQLCVHQRYSEIQVISRALIVKGRFPVPCCQWGCLGQQVPYACTSLIRRPPCGIKSCQSNVLEF